MALPVLLRPKYLLRRKAVRSGVFGSSRAWRAVAFVIIFENGLRRFFGKQPDKLFIRSVGVGRVLTVAAYAPMSRRQRKRSGVTKATLEAAARADLASTQSAS
jgi:hypothetical protein